MEVEKKTQEFENSIVTTITLEECLKCTEECGYRRKGTVKKLLEDGQIIFTPFASYKKRSNK